MKSQKPTINEPKLNYYFLTQAEAEAESKNMEIFATRRQNNGLSFIDFMWRQICKLLFYYEAYDNGFI